MNEILVKLLFKTNAVRVSPENNPFWYTSGTLGPYYINTHFLYGNESKANELLAIIDKEKNDILTCPDKITELTLNNYESDEIYRTLIDIMTLYIRDNINDINFDVISGGERRDWFFSNILANFFGKPLLTIYKDLKCVLTSNGKTTEIDDLGGLNVLHIADLITEASSYERAWIPAVNKLGAKMENSLVVVDRMQGGKELLDKHSVLSHSLVQIDENLFKMANEMGLIDNGQLKLVLNYLKNPKESMKQFLLDNPMFLKNTLDSGTKDSIRAKLCIDKNIYGLENVEG